MDTLIVSLLFPTLAGFIILTRVPFFQFHYKYTGYQRLLLESALLGMFMLFVITICEALLLSFLRDPIEIDARFSWLNIQSGIKDASNLNINSESFLTLIFSILCVVLFQIFKFFDKNKYDEFIIKRKTLAQPNALENLFLDCYSRTQPVMINLKNRKCYIGLITDFGEVTDLHEKKFIRMLPTSSGVRHPDTLIFEPQHTYNWLELVSRLGEQDQTLANDIVAALKVSMVINMDEILSATIWMEDLYEDLQSSN